MTEVEVKALVEAFGEFTRTTRRMEESYRLLEARVHELDRELAAKNQELAYTSDYLNYILESMSDGVMAIDTEGILTAHNQAASNILGYSASETIGRPFREVFGREFWLPGDGTEIRDLRTKEGKRVPVSERNSPISDRSGRHIGEVKVFQDLREIEALRERVRQQDRLAAVGELAASVAHEIRNPLGGIRGFAALLARDIDPADPRARLVEKILVGARDLDQVVSELLEYTRPLQLNLRPTSCASLVEAALGYLDIEDRPVALVNTVEQDLRVLADPDKMRQVLLNVLLNAVQSIEQEGEVRITSSRDSNSITIAVSDTGCGIAPDLLRHVFSPFFTTKEKGTGLGLAVASKIVECHGGRLEATSELTKGSTFYVRLPRAD